MIVAVTGFAFLVSLTPSDSLRAQINAANKSFEALMVKKDLTGLMAIMKEDVTPDFKHVEDGKTINFQQMSSMMKMGLGMMGKITQAVYKTTDVKVTGTHGTSTTFHKIAGTMVGADKKSHTMVFTGTTTDSYTKDGAKWKMSKMVWTSQTRSVDGKVLGAAK
jgi:ketosteroid isomerase-like protein